MNLSRRILPCVAIAMLMPSIEARGDGGSPAAEFPREFYGVYEVEGGGRIFIVQESGNTLAGFPPAEVRGVAPDPAGGFLYGTSLGSIEPPEGHISFETGPAGTPPGLRWTPAGESPRAAEQIPIRTEEVEFRNGRIKLAGTLFLPSGLPPYPAIVLTHGSGPEVRGPGFDPFFFASLGLAVLTYDKRGTGGSSGKEWRAPFSDYADDALAGVSLLGKRDDILPDSIGLHGPSQGGWIVVLAASRSSDVAFIIMRNGNVVSPREQNKYHLHRRMDLKLPSLTEDEKEAILAYVDLRMDYVITGQGKKEFEAAREAKKKQGWGKYVSDRVPEVPFWGPNGEYDSLSVLRDLRCPLLALFGGRDNYSSTEQNVPLMERILTESGHTDFTIKVFPEANHGMFETNTGDLLEDELPNLKRLAPGYLETLTEWLQSHVIMPDVGSR